MKRGDILLVGEVVLWIGLQLIRASASRGFMDPSSVKATIDEFRAHFDSRDRNPQAL